jgi:hypothetical protein
MAGGELKVMWLRLIVGGFFAALGIALLISVGLTPISSRCVRFYGAIALLMGVPGLLVFAKGLKELASLRRRRGPGGTQPRNPE